MPSMERIRFVSSGTEATMSAVRVARAATGRDQHHQVRGLLSRPRRCVSRAGRLRRDDARRADEPGRRRRRRRATRWSRATTTSTRSSGSSIRTTEQIAARDRRADRRQHGAGAAARRLPRGPARALRPRARAPGLRRGDLRDSARRRAARSRSFGVKPDLTCLGKIIGGGLPVGAYGGRADVMELVAPAGPVYQAGTLSGNPLAMTAGLWSLEQLSPKLVSASREAGCAAGRRSRRRRARRRMCRCRSTPSARC